MCAHAENTSKCPLCEGQPSFSKDQIAFLEDVLINQGCMRAMMNGRCSSQPEKCRECALVFADIVEIIRNMREH
jgi:hypothetical protein